MVNYANKKFYFHMTTDDDLLIRAYKRLDRQYPVNVVGKDIYLGVHKSLFYNMLMADLAKTDEYKLFKIVDGKNHTLFKHELISSAKKLVDSLIRHGLKVPQAVKHTVDTLSTLSVEHSDILDLYNVVEQLKLKVDEIVEKDRESKFFDSNIKLSVLQTLLRRS